jgi:lipopolysaccharide transport system permease protein
MKEDQNWYLIIRPKSTWLDLQLGEVWKYRDLIYMFVKRDFVSQYKQTILGPLWFIIQPVLTTVTFMVIFGGIAKISTDGQPQVLFYMSGIMLWSYFSSCLTKTADTFTANSNIFGKVYFPRLTVPISNVISTLVTLGIQLLIFLAIYVYYIFTSNALHPNFYILLFPYLILLMAVQGLGFGIIISSLTTKYRDLKFLITFGVQLLMYATPVAYPLSVLSEKYKIWIIWNPMTAIIETFRFGALGTGTFRWEYLIYSSFVSFFVLLIGTLIFNKVEKTFMDTV